MSGGNVINYAGGRRYAERLLIRVTSSCGLGMELSVLSF